MLIAFKIGSEYLAGVCCSITHTLVSVSATGMLCPDHRVPVCATVSLVHLLDEPDSYQLPCAALRIHILICAMLCDKYTSLSPLLLVISEHSTRIQADLGWINESRR